MADVVFTRLAPEHYYVVTGTGFAAHDFQWIREHLPKDGAIVTTDVSSAYAVINICGPRARDVLSAVTADDVSNACFPYMTCRNINVGLAPVRAQRAGFVGELGWELHVPSEYAVHVFETLEKAGEAHGLQHVGYKTIDSLRLEKAYKVWGTDLTAEDNPYEAGLGGFIRLSKPSFIGRDALLRIKQQGPARTLACFSLDKPAELFGGEAIIADGSHVGYATSAGFGHTVQRSVVMGYIPADCLIAKQYEVEADGLLIKATRHDRPLYDPGNERVRS
jgi:4-methylaminobutanoate oxidase (formaldehyde-forming)